MSESKHTPGPWKQGVAKDSVVAINNDRPLKHADGEEYSEAAYYGGQLICECVEERNISIICATPALLEALKLCLPWLEEDCQYAGRDVNPKLVAAMKQARAAIDQAEGR